MIISFIISFLEILIKLLYWGIFINILLSWFSQGRTPLGIWLDEIIKPVLWPFRWAKIGMFDLSALLALLLLSFLGTNIQFFITKIITFFSHISFLS